MPTARSYADVPLSMAHLCELDTPPADLIEIAAKAGLASVGLRLHPAAAGGISYPLSGASEQAEVRRQIATTGVGVEYIELISITEATRATDYRAMLETGAAIGATRLAVGSDTSNHAVAAEKLAAICDLAQPFGMAVDLEFMPFRGIRSLADAISVVEKCGRSNAHILVDALHIRRSGTTIEDLRRLNPRHVGTYQICDAPLAAPTDLVAEARTRRLIPGQGELAIFDQLDALPAGTGIGVEVPMAPLFPGLTPAERLARLVTKTKAFLARRRSS